MHTKKFSLILEAVMDEEAFKNTREIDVTNNHNIIITPSHLAFFFAVKNRIT